MKAVRVYAVGRNDEYQKFILLARVDARQRLDRDVEAFGSIAVLAEDDNRWTTALFQLVFRDSGGVIWYGDTGFEDGWTNIYTKRMLPGEMFTVRRQDEGSADAVYSIRTVTVY